MIQTSRRAKNNNIVVAKIKRSEKTCIHLSAKILYEHEKKRRGKNLSAE